VQEQEQVLAMEKAQEQVWVQVWTAQVPGSVQVKRSELEKILPLVSPMVPMMVTVKE
jgi:hypothetical protein